MPYELAPFASIPLSEALLEQLIADHEAVRLPRMARLWRYFRNPLAEPNERGGSGGAPAQSGGLPDRLINHRRPQLDDRIAREVVIENDIGWRINALVDFMFPESPRIVSRASDPERRHDIEALLNAIIDASGGITLWQNAALLASVYGSVDFLLQLRDLTALAGAARSSRPANGIAGEAPSKPSIHDLASRAASHISIETVEAPRAIPLPDPNDYRRLDAFILHFEQPVHDVAIEPTYRRLARRILGRPAGLSERATVTVTEIHSAHAMQRYVDGRLVNETRNRLGRIPIVHVQNLAQPLVYDGLSDVEPLIPLQDELNTRLSDRANRVTLQSFRMWLGKGIDGFTDRPIGPGQMWVTDNPEAAIEAFGGDAESPSERAHLEDLREALDKASGVTPAAAGHIKARIGNLTSENALRISLMGTIAKMKRKRITFGAGIAQLAELILHALDVHGVYRTPPGQRGIDVIWPDPLPPDATRRIQDALAKAQLGVPLQTLRAELGYAEAEGTGH